MYSENDKKFAAEFLEKVTKKLTAIAPKIGADFPYPVNFVTETVELLAYFFPCHSV